MSKVTELVKAAGATNPEYLADETDIPNYSTARQAIADKMTTLVKGVGYAVTDKPTAFGQGGNQPLIEPSKVFSRAMRAEKAFNTAVRNGHRNPDMVIKSFNPEFARQFGAFAASNANNMGLTAMVASLQQQVSQALGKSITLTTPLATGFVPFNLVAP